MIDLAELFAMSLLVGLIVSYWQIPPYKGD